MGAVSPRFRDLAVQIWPIDKLIPLTGEMATLADTGETFEGKKATLESTGECFSNA